MTDQELFPTTKAFIEGKTACKEALVELKRGAEIRLILDQRIECACFNDGETSRLEKRPAVKPDVEFRISNEAVRRLADIPGDNLADTGIEILREVISGNIQVKLVGSVRNVLTHGYLGIMKKAGPEFFSFLAQKGLSNIFKVMAYIKKMKG